MRFWGLGTECCDWHRKKLPDCMNRRLANKLASKCVEVRISTYLDWTHVGLRLKIVDPCPSLAPDPELTTRKRPTIDMSLTTEVYRCAPLRGVIQLTILLLILACVSITRPSNVIDLEKERNKRTAKSCLGVFYECYWNASTPRRRRYCVLRFTKCSIQSENIDDSFQRLRRKYKANLELFQDIFDVDWW
ncbi:hypothetical protein ScPMuIL_016963 [Solemya velum]